MAGAFSRHLVHSYYASQAMNSSIVTSGAMSFNPSMHGTPVPSFPSSRSPIPFTSTPFANENMSEETAMKIAALQVKLNQKLGPEYISQRQGPRGGPKLTYAEGWKIINLANEVFGFNGWSSNVVNVTTDFVDRTESGRYNVGVSAVVRVTLRDGVYHEDIGCGTADNSPSKGQALDKCKKEAVTDGLKRALRNFGNLMGNCLYDRAYTQEVVKMRVPPAKFDKSELHRRPEFAEETKPSINPPTTASRPPVPPFNPNTATSPSISASSSTIGQPINNREPLPNGRAPIKRQPSKNLANTNNSNTSNISSSTDGNASVQSTSDTSNQYMRHPRQHHPQQQQQQSHRVSFTEGSAQDSRIGIAVPAETGQPVIAKAEAEESFDFGDDDVFLAALGIEEGDLGRPIETEADMGQPIALDETFLPPDGDVSVTTSETSVGDISKNSIPPREKATRLRRWQEILDPNPTSNTNPLETSPPIQQSTPTEQVQAASSSTSSFSNDQKASTFRPLNSISRQNQPGHIPAQRNHRPLNRPSPIQNENENPNPAPSSSGESGGKRPLTPSIGGFHFPPGMNPLQNHNTNLHQGQRVGTGSGIGMKRPVDAMVASTSEGSSRTNVGSHRGPRPGMGLQQAATPRREPFAPLEVEEGGDVKRIKR